MNILDLDLDSLEFDNIGSWPLWIRQIMVGLVCVGILGVAYYYDLEPEWDKYVHMQENRYLQQKVFAEKQAQVQHLDAYKEQMDLIRETFEILKRQLPEENEGALFLEAISQQASAAGLTFLSIKPGPREDKGFYIEYPLELKLSGSYHGMGAFVSHLSSMSRMVTLQDLSMKAAKPEKALFGIVEITLMAKTYSTKEF